MDLPGSSSMLNKEVSVCRCLHDNRGWEIEESSIWKVENQGIRWLKFISGSKTTSRAWNYTTQWSKFYVKSSFLRTGSRNIQGQKRMKVKPSLCFPFGLSEPSTGEMMPTAMDEGNFLSSTNTLTDARWHIQLPIPRSFFLHLASTHISLNHT